MTCRAEGTGTTYSFHVETFSSIDETSLHCDIKNTDKAKHIVIIHPQRIRHTDPSVKDKVKVKGKVLRDTGRLHATFNDQRKNNSGVSEWEHIDDVSKKVPLIISHIVFEHHSKGTQHIEVEVLLKSLWEDDSFEEIIKFKFPIDLQ